MTRKKDIKKFIGDLAIDDRGVVKFVNNFDFKGIKRFYLIENFSKDTIRAFHGHKNQGLYVYVSSGSIIFCIVPIDNSDKPSKTAKVERFILSCKKPEIIYIPPNYANGFKSLEENTKVIFFSTSSLNETKKDNFRYPFNYWGTDIWEVKNK